MRAVAVALAALSALGGCYRTVYHFEAPPQARSQRYDEAWRTSIIAGVLELNAPVSLDEACPGGRVARVEEESGVLNVLAAMVLNAVLFELPLFHFRSVSVDCAYGGVPEGPVAPRPGGIRP
jgi:hypothetical protein